MPRLEGAFQKQDGWSRSLASVRLLLAGHPIRQVLRALEAGSLAAGPPVVCCNTPGQVYIIKPAAESVALVFPIRFRSRQDAAIGVACLQEFVDARRGPSLGRAPTCAYSPREAPREVADVDLSSVLEPGGLSGGFLTFTLSRRHVAGPQVEGVVWSMATLHQFVAYHVKATKAMMHSRMRRRVASMVELLQQSGAAGGGAGAGAASGAGGGGAAAGGAGAAAV
ncbi:ARPC2 protein [Gonium pectorale]|uniref:Arp2/3 complex 34 kDa subunit n=1 Tax=Gonium pectorale TaxID=33097 RepID=A0A150GS43_GONPE|nr:ARPC2 protein [Gonium pectorale]|eukprot:KXZ52667.1 ARPC2 protein [Gonium pectorale]